MSKTLIMRGLTLIAALTAPVACLVFASAPSAPTGPASAAGPAGTEPEGFASRSANIVEADAMHLDIHRAIAEERSAVEALEARAALESDPGVALELQNEIQEKKREAEIRILEIQLLHAREAGRSDVAGRLEEVLRSIQEPRPVLMPVERPVPAVQAEPR